MIKTNEWRQFEQLVSRIEAAAAPRNAIVKSPDRIPDLVTGQLREVDASIRLKIGTVDILMTIECRKRKRKEDVTWIEQLAVKRTKIGAAKTIAVSASGFSDSAYHAARQHNIELRTLLEVAPADVDSWFMPGGAVHLFREVEEVLCVWYLYGADGKTEDTPHGITDPFWSVFYHGGIKSPFPAIVLFQWLEQAEPKCLWSIPLDGSKTQLQFKIHFPAHSLFVQPGSAQTKQAIHHIFIDCKVSYQSAICPLEKGEHHLYSSPTGEVIQRSAFQAELFGLPVQFDHQSDSLGQVTVSCQFNPKQD